MLRVAVQMHSDWVPTALPKYVPQVREKLSSRNTVSIDEKKLL